MATPETTTKPRKARLKPELSIFEDELTIPFNKSEFLPDLPPHARSLESTKPTESLLTCSTDAPRASGNDSGTENQAPTLPATAIEAPVESVTIREQTGNKPRTNREQTGNKPRTNREQTGNKTSGFATPKIETGNKLAAKPATLSVTKRQQTENKLATDAPFSGLVGLQRAILILIYDACKAARDRVSGALTLEHLAWRLKTSPGSVKTTLQRLEAKGYILRVAFKNGRGGWSRYELPEAIFRELLQLETENKLETNWQQSDNKATAKPATQPATSFSSSSSILDLENSKTTTTGEPDFLVDQATQLSAEWAEVDLTPLGDVGFSRAHLIQLARHGKLTPDEVQDSIHHFAFDLNQNGKGQNLKGPPISFFMGILRKGVPYAPPENFESPVEAARRLYVESKRRIEERRQAEERELMELEFAEWRRGLSSELLATLVPEVVRNIASARESSLRSHFNEAVWPEIRGGVPGFFKNERAEISHQIEQSLKRGQV
jgi:hypothetical protein